MFGSGDIHPLEDEACVRMFRYSTDLKNKGNELYKKGDYAGATDLYLKATNVFDQNPVLMYKMGMQSSISLSDQTRLHVSTKCNLALSLLKTNHFDAAANHCRAALAMVLGKGCSPWAREGDITFFCEQGEPLFQKALKRRSLAFEGMGNYAAAAADLRLLPQPSWDEAILSKQEFKAKQALHGFLLGEMCSTAGFRPQGRPPYGNGGFKLAGIGATTKAEEYGIHIWRWGQSAVEYKGRHFFFGGSPYFDWEQGHARLPESDLPGSYLITVRERAFAGVGRMYKEAMLLHGEHRETVPPFMHHTAVVYQQQMYVYGGLRMDLEGKPHPASNKIRKQLKREAHDMWALDLERFAAGFKKITASGTCPGPRAHHSAAVDKAGGKMYVFGGWAYTEAARDKMALGDLWEYDFGSSAWRLLWRHDPSLEGEYTEVNIEDLGPLPRWGHASWVSQGGLYIYGGGRPRDNKLDLEDERVGGWNVWQYGSATRTLGDMWRWDMEKGTWSECLQRESWPGTRMLMGATQYKESAEVDVVVIAGGLTTDAFMSLPRTTDDGQESLELGLHAYLADVFALKVEGDRLEWFQVNPAGAKSPWLTARMGCAVVASKRQSGRHVVTISGGYAGPQWGLDSKFHASIDLQINFDGPDTGTPALSTPQLEAHLRAACDRYTDGIFKFPTDMFVPHARHSPTGQTPTEQEDMLPWMHNEVSGDNRPVVLTALEAPNLAPHCCPPPSPETASLSSTTTDFGSSESSRNTPSPESSRSRPRPAHSAAPSLESLRSTPSSAPSSSPSPESHSRRKKHVPYLDRSPAVRMVVEANSRIYRRGTPPALMPLADLAPKFKLLLDVEAALFELDLEPLPFDFMCPATEVARYKGPDQMLQFCKQRYKHGPMALILAPREPADELGCCWWAGSQYKVLGFSGRALSRPWRFYQSVKVFGTARAAEEYYTKSLAAHGADPTLPDMSPRLTACINRVAPQECRAVLPEMLQQCRHRIWDANAKRLIVAFTYGNVWCKLVWLFDPELIQDDGDDWVLRVTFPTVAQVFRPIRQGTSGEVKVECASCGKWGALQDLKRCAGCRLLRYCSPECQTAHWSTHKPVCKAKGVEEVRVLS